MKHLVRFAGAPIGTLVLMASFLAGPALAGGGGPPPGPPIFNVSAPSVSWSHDGPARSVDLAFTVSCNDQAIAEQAEVQIVGHVLQKFGRGTIGGANEAYVTCAPGTQSIIVPVAGSGLSFHPGKVWAFAEFHGCISTTCIDGVGGREEWALPAN